MERNDSWTLRYPFPNSWNFFFWIITTEKWKRTCSNKERETQKFIFSTLHSQGPEPFLSFTFHTDETMLYSPITMGTKDRNAEPHPSPMFCTQSCRARRKTFWAQVLTLTADHSFSGFVRQMDWRIFCLKSGKPQMQFQNLLLDGQSCSQKLRWMLTRIVSTNLSRIAAECCVGSGWYACRNGEGRMKRSLAAAEVLLRPKCSVHELQRMACSGKSKTRILMIHRRKRIRALWKRTLAWKQESFEFYLCNQCPCTDVSSRLCTSESPVWPKHQRHRRHHSCFIWLPLHRSCLNLSVVEEWKCFARHAPASHHRKPLWRSTRVGNFADHFWSTFHEKGGCFGSMNVPNISSSHLVKSFSRTEFSLLFII